MITSIPNSCGSCKYGNTYDISIDDLRSFCALTGYSEDWCDFPNRRDETLRMQGCPLPDPSERQIRKGNELLSIHKQKKKAIKRSIYGKSFRIRKKNSKRLMDDLAKIDTGKIPWEWFR